MRWHDQPTFNPRPSLSALYKDEETADVRITLDDGTTIHAHRAVLAASSPVFRRTLFGPTKLPVDEPLALPGEDVNAVKALIAYCYGENGIINYSTVSSGLGRLANKYEMKALSQDCTAWQLAAESD